MSDETSWVYDSLVGFLAGPVWQVPILTFIENKSLIFEPDHEDSEYKKIYEEYRGLVDMMLCSYREDLNITPAQFTGACQLGREKGRNVSQFRQGLFEQVYAAEDFTVFTRMMTQKNIELQLQALELLRAKYGVLPMSLQPKASDAASSGEQSHKDKKSKPVKKQSSKEFTESESAPALEDVEKSIMQEVTRKSMEDKETNKEVKELGEILAKSSIDQKRLQAQMQEEKERMEKHLFSKGKEPADSSNTEAALLSSQVSEMEIDPDELKRRTEFLKAQRDKLLQLKQAERAKQLTEATSSGQSKFRPKSAKAARSALAGSSRNPHAVDPDTLAARRALAEKLKNEVISHTDK